MAETIKSILNLVLIAGLSAAVGVGAVWGYNSLFRQGHSVTEQGDFSSFQAQVNSEIVMFGTSTCPYCAKARELLTELDVEYHEYRLDSETADQARALFEQLNGKGVPVLLIGNTRINGFSEQHIRNALEDISPAVAAAP